MLAVNISFSVYLLNQTSFSLGRLKLVVYAGRMCMMCNVYGDERENSCNVGLAYNE